MPPGGCNAFLALRSLTLAAVTQNLPVLQCRAVVPPRMQQSAAAQCSRSSVVQQSRVQPAAAAGLRPLQSTPGRGCSPLCSRARPRLGCGLRRRLQLGWRPAMLLQASTHPAVLHTACSCSAMHTCTAQQGHYPAELAATALILGNQGSPFSQEAYALLLNISRLSDPTYPVGRVVHRLERSSLPATSAELQSLHTACPQFSFFQQAQI